MKKFSLSLVLIFLTLYAFGQEVKINNQDAMAAVATESFSFVYIGHAYGSDNDSDYWQANSIDYPATSLLSNISLLKQHDFAIFGGDMIQQCTPEVLEALQDSLLERLNMPIFNSASKRDLCLADKYSFKNTIAMVHGNNLFLFVSSEQETLEKEQAIWLSSKLSKALENTEVENVFMFTSKPFFLGYHPELQQAANLANVPIESNSNSQEIILSALDDYADSQKRVHWFASDIGRNYPVIFHNYNERVSFIASGIYDNAFDHVLTVTVDSQPSKAVDIEITTIGEQDYGTIEAYSHQWLNEFIIGSTTSSLDYVTRLNKIMSDILDKFALVEKLNDDVYLDYNTKGSIGWATYDDKKRTLSIGGWAPTQEELEDTRWFGYEGDLSLELLDYKTIVRKDVAKRFGNEQLYSGFEITFRHSGAKDALQDSNLCFFSKTANDGLFILPFDSRQQSFKCKIFPNN